MQRKTIQILSLALFILLLFWGGYTLLYYLGVPVHGSVLLPEAAKKMIQETCAPGGFICRGWNAFFPYIFHTIARAKPFLWYGVLSAIGYVLFLGWRGLTTGQFYLRLTLKPWKILLLFLGSLWLIFTVISFMQSGDASIRRVVEPLPFVYVNVGAEALEELQANFQDLQERGCLKSVGQFANGAGVFELTTRCVQVSFVTRVLSQLLFILLFLFELLIAGRLILHLLRLRPSRLLVESMVSVGLGVCGWIALLWTVAIVGSYTSTVGWLLLLAIPAIGYRHALYWIRRFLSASWDVDVDWYSPVLLLAWLLMGYLALNFLNVVRPFPIGWDDLGSYLNRPHLMVSYGHFIFSMPTFAWEYLTSLGFLLFGYDSIFGATSSMLINWTAGLLATLSVFTFTNVFLGRGRGILAALLYYALPLVGHFSFADMKIDNAVFMMGTMGTLALFIALFSPEEEDTSSQKKVLTWIALAGFFVGFAFSMKATAVMVVMELGVILVGGLLHGMAFVGAMLVALAVFMQKNTLDLNRIAERVLGEGVSIDPTWFIVGFALLGLGLIVVLLLRHRKKMVLNLLSISVFVLGMLLAIAPWVLHNNFLRGNVIPTFVLGTPNTITPIIDLWGTQEQKPDGPVVRSLPSELALDRENSACEPTGHKEELDRYWGFRKGWTHYLTLPWRSVMNIDSAGYYVTTMPALLLFPLLILLPFFWRERGRWLRWLYVGTLFILLEWIFLANGIPWYGIGVFLGLVVGLEALIARAPDLPNRILASVLIAASLFVMFGNRFWQFEQQRNLFEYPIGKVSATALQERTIPYYDDIRDAVSTRHKTMKDRPYLYRVGTFIPYFIPRNLEIIVTTDHQLDTFNCLYQERDPQLTLQRLKALGFNSIIFDTNTATIEKDPNGSLHQKVSAFVDFLNNPDLGLQVVINDSGAGVVFVLIP